MTSHKHAALFHAVATGEADEWECCALPFGNWEPVICYLSAIAYRPLEWAVRRKAPATKVVTFECWKTPHNGLMWYSKVCDIDIPGWTRIPSLDKTAEVPAP